MLRRSIRLQEGGYYTEEGTPWISYREKLFRVFQRRKRNRPNIPVGHTDNSPTNRNNHADLFIDANQRTQTLRRDQTTELGQKTSETQTTKSSKCNGPQKTLSSSFGKCISAVLLLLLLWITFGTKGDNSWHLDFQNMKENFRSLQEKISRSFPLADTMSNFALESQGARTLQHLSTDTYWPQENVNFIWDKAFNWWSSSKKQRGVIQSHSMMKPGECWPFSGARGHLFISLSHPVFVTHVTLGHITKSQSPVGNIATAPKEFSIYGMMRTDEEGTFLGRMVYDQDGKPHQTFDLPNPDKGVFRYVKLQIENNWGNIDYTCLYNFRVHVMLRRSIRLQEGGYYTEEGTPWISYREKLFRVFQRRKRNRTNIPVGHTDNSTTDRNNHADLLIDANQRTQTLRRDQTTELGQKTSETQTTKSSKCNGPQKTLSSSFGKCISAVLLLLLLWITFGTKGDNSWHLDFQNMKENFRSLQEKISRSFPLADTMSNFALESQGARTLQHLSTDTYWPQENVNFIWDKAFHWWSSSKKQRGVIQSHSMMKPGECWPFSGARGHLFISLSHPVFVTHVTLGHITKSQSPVGNIATAPREFSIYGMMRTDEEGTFLGRMVYDQDGKPHQTFDLPNPDKGVFRYVKLQIENNWGNIDYTCLYNFRVHGKLPHTAGENLRSI